LGISVHLCLSAVPFSSLDLIDGAIETICGSESRRYIAVPKVGILFAKRPNASVAKEKLKIRFSRVHASYKMRTQCNGFNRLYSAGYPCL